MEKKAWRMQSEQVESREYDVHMKKNRLERQ